MYTEGNVCISFNFGEEIPIIKGFAKISSIFILVGSNIWFIII